MTLRPLVVASSTISNRRSTLFDASPARIAACLMPMKFETRTACSYSYRSRVGKYDPATSVEVPIPSVMRTSWREMSRSAL